MDICPSCESQPLIQHNANEYYCKSCKKWFELDDVISYNMRGLTQRALDGACTSCKLELTPQCPIRTGNGCDLYQPRQ